MITSSGAAPDGSTAQSWQFTGGHLQVLGNCAEPAGDGTANNTLIVLEPCSATTAAQNWTAGPNGSWVNASSGKCLDDPGSTKTPGAQLQLFTCNKTAAQSWASQQYTWTPQGKVASIAALPASGTTPQTTSYIYTADGDEITETGPAGTTLFLPGEQLTVNGTTTTGMRYYTFAGKPIAESNGTSLYWTEANLQGTLQVALNAFSESSPVTRRTVTPYGGMVPAASTWPDNRTFLNDPSTAAGLIDIGARKYNPVTGTFLSVDPVLDPADPQSMTGYAYAAGDPVNASDPTGLCAKSMPDEQTQVDCAGKVVNPPPACTFFCGPDDAKPNLTPGEHARNGADRPYTPPPPTPGRPPVEPVEPAPTNTTPLPSDPTSGIGGLFGGGIALLGSIATGGTAAGAGAGGGVAAGGGGAWLTRVGRWMSAEEYQGMLDSGMVQRGRTGVINVAHPADPLSFIRQAAPGSRYVEFDVPLASLVPGGKEGWATIPGADSIFSRLNLRRGLLPYEFPAALNVEWVASKLFSW